MDHRLAAAVFAATMCALVPARALAGPCYSSLLPTPNIGASGALVAVSGTSINDVWAVGWYKAEAGKKIGLVEHFDGTSWSVQSNAIQDPLKSVSEVDPANVWAVGKGIWHWDGITWQHMRGAAARRGTYHYANAISADRANPNQVWAVGVEGLEGISESWPWAELWNGAKWTGWALPGGAKTSELLAVTTLANGNAWAVGDGQPGRFNQTMPITDKWNGTRWISTKPGNEFGALWSVAAEANDDVWAVGGHDSGSADIEHWNGVTWMESAFELPRSVEIDSVAASSMADAWIAGHFLKPYSSIQSVVLEHWDGNAWTRASSLNIVAETAVTGIADFGGEAIAVGFAREPNGGPGRPSQTIAFVAQCRP